MWALIVLLAAACVPLGQAQGVCSYPDCPPIAFMPGMFGNYMQVEVEGTIPAKCPQHSPLIWPTDFSSSECSLKLLRQTYDASKNKFSDLKNVNVSVTDMGKWSSILPGLEDFHDTVVGWGYTEDLDFVALPYDPRWSGWSLAQTSWADQVASTIEKVAIANGRLRKVYLLAWSNGGPTGLDFLNSRTREWKEKFIAGFLTFSGNFIGQTNTLEMVGFGSDQWTRDLFLQMEGVAWSFPDPRYFPDGEPYITTPEAGTVTIQQAPEFLRTKAKGSAWVKQFGLAWGKLNPPRLVYPSVNIYCFMGSALPINNSWTFADNDVISKAPTSTGQDNNSDGNQDWVDNTSCLAWKTPAQQAGKDFSLHDFPGVSHMEEPNSPDVLAEVLSIIKQGM